MFISTLSHNLLRQTLKCQQQIKFSPFRSLYRCFVESPKPFDIKHVKTAAGSGRINLDPGEEFARNRGPVSWAAFSLMAVASASAVGYFQVQRERILEQALGKVVSSTYYVGGVELDAWSDPEFC
jgi:hypothetical protein